MTKTQLRKRWGDPGFIEQLAVPTDRMPDGSSLHGIDLRGVPKLALSDPLWHFSIRDARANDIDFSFGDGCLGVIGSSVTHLCFDEFKFDQASSFLRSSFCECSFERARLRLNAMDCEFTKCIFDLSTFAGGFSEYGFTRCKFTDCTFRSARWKGTYFKACTFELCDMTQLQIIDSMVTSIKHRECTAFTEHIFIGSDIRTITEIA
jgi:uncharacterized protein YjbI with pentapeptide repeats